MANGRNKGKRGADNGRDAGPFVAMPWSVLDSPAYLRLSHPARALLMELARQFVRDNNGRLLASMAYLQKRGWNSADTITRAKRELLAAGLIHETVQGHRPNKASWYAITWRALDRLPGYDYGATEGFIRGAYQKNASLIPSRGVGTPLIAPPHGAGAGPPKPSRGAIRAVSRARPTPVDGNHLERPSVVAGAAQTTDSRNGDEPQLDRNSARTSEAQTGQRDRLQQKVTQVDTQTA